MECNIIRIVDRKPEKKQCFKTKYKNIVIVKLENRCYSITHYQTGIAITFDRYTSIKKALMDLDDAVYKTREILERNGIKSFKQYCKQRNIKQINF